MSVPRVHGHGPAGQVTCRSSPTSTSSSPPSRCDGHGAVAAAQHARDGGAASRRCRRTASPPPRARRSARGSRPSPSRAPERDVRAVREELGVGLDRRADRRAGRAPRARPSHLDRALRVADRQCWNGELARPRPPAPSRRPLGKSVEAAGAAHVDAAGGRAGDRGPDLAGGGLDRERVGVGPAVAAQVHDRLARAVAGQLGLRAVGVEDPQAARRSPRSLGLGRAAGCRRSRYPMCRAQISRHARRGQLPRAGRDCSRIT